MKVSLSGGSDARTVSEVVARVKAAEEAGFPAIWFPQEFHIDTLTALSVAAYETREIEIGTAVIPVQGRHPIALAQQALAVAQVAGVGRFTLGIGVSHARTSERGFGVPYAGIVDRCEDYVRALDLLLSEERTANFVGEHLTARATLNVVAPVPGLVLGALGPRMLDLAGRFTDGVVTWMAGRVAIGRDVVPRVNAAAATVGRPAPRVIVSLPICVTDRSSAARDALRPLMERTARWPSYGRMIALQGLVDPVDLALIGDEDAVAEEIANLGHVGATEFLAIVVGTREEAARTREFLVSLQARSATTRLSRRDGGE